MNIPLDIADVIKALREYKPTVEFVKIHPGAKTPEYANIDDSGADLFSVETVNVGPGETAKISTGLVVALEEGWELQVRSKGGLASKSIWVANSPGTSDEGYRGEVFVLYHNGSNKMVTVRPGEKLAQAVVAMYWQANYECAEEYRNLQSGEEVLTTEELIKVAAGILPPARSSRGAGCLGSTGK